MSGHVSIRDAAGKQAPVRLYVVSVERTYCSDFVVAAVDQTEARKVAARECDPSDDGEMDTSATVICEVTDASHLPYGFQLADEPDARTYGIPRHTILDFLGPQESPEERAVRLHNEQMAKLQGVLF